MNGRMNRGPTISKNSMTHQSTMSSIYKVAKLTTMGFVAFAAARYIDSTPVKPSFIRVDHAAKQDSNIYLSTRNFRWIKHDAETDTYNICTNAPGCNPNADYDKWKVSRQENPESYSIIENMITRNP